MTVNIHAAKTNLSKLIERVRRGEEVTIARGSEAVARLVPIHYRTPQRKAGTLKGKLKVSKRFFEPLSDDELKRWNS